MKLFGKDTNYYRIIKYYVDEIFPISTGILRLANEMTG